MANVLVPWETDIQKRYVELGYSDMTKATIIPVCRPEGGYNIIRNDKFKLITLLMPLQISIYEKKNGDVYISRMKVKMMGALMTGVKKKEMMMSGNLIEKTLKGIIVHQTVG